MESKDATIEALCTNLFYLLYCERTFSLQVLLSLMSSYALAKPRSEPLAAHSHQSASEAYLQSLCSVTGLIKLPTPPPPTTKELAYPTLIDLPSPLPYPALPPKGYVPPTVVNPPSPCLHPHLPGANILIGPKSATFALKSLSSAAVGALPTSRM